jgi:D-lactate dehydrogenase (cytochrome)
MFTYLLRPECVELLDDHSRYDLFLVCGDLTFVTVMRSINEGGLVDAPYPVHDTLFFKIQGDAESIQSTSEIIQAIVRRHHSSRFEFAASDLEAEELWQNRKYALSSTLAAAPGYRCWTTDVCVPVSRLPELVHRTKKDLANSGLKSTIVGHVGDGTRSL